MPIAFLRIGNGAQSSSAVEIVKFGFYLWCEEVLRANIVLLLHNNASSRDAFDRLRIIFPYRLEAGSVNNESRLLEDESYPLNYFKRGPYHRGNDAGVITCFDGISNVKVLTGAVLQNETGGSNAGETEWASLDVIFRDWPLRPGDTGALLLTFKVPQSSASGTKRGLTYERTDTGLNFAIRIFDRYYLAHANGCPEFSDADIIEARVLYDKNKRYGGFDINLFVPTSYMDGKTSPEAEYLDVAAYDYAGKAAKQKFTRLVWRARSLIKDVDVVKCGDRMVLSGVFVNPSEVLARVESVSRNLDDGLSKVTELVRALAGC